MASLIFGLQIFKKYLLGRHFIVRVDHMALKYYSTTPEPVGQQARYLDFIAQFDFDIEHRSGINHGNCDSLSRLRPCERDTGEPCKQCNRRVTGKHKMYAVQTRAQRQRQQQAGDGSVGQASGELYAGPTRDTGRDVTAGSPRVTLRAGVGVQAAASSRQPVEACDSSRWPAAAAVAKRGALLQRTAPAAAAAGVSNWSPQFIAEQQKLDSDIGPVFAWLAGGSRPDWKVVQGTSPTTRALWQQFESLVTREGVIYRIFHNADGSARFYQLVLPASLKASFLELIHADLAGHLKFVKCASHLQQRAWWFTWRRDLRLFIACCAKCSAYHRGNPPKQGDLQPMVLGGPAERWCVDLTGPHPISSDQHKYIFTAICAFTKYAIAVPIRNKEAATVAKAIMDNIFLKWGLCFEILTDQGKEFEADLTRELFDLLGICKLRTSGYRPQTNGACEAQHKALNAMLAKVISESQRDWSKWVGYATFCYNATEHSATGFSPFFLMTGREPRWNVDFVLHGVEPGHEASANYASKMIDRLDRSFKLARDHLGRAAVQASTWYNKRVNRQVFYPGQKVRVYNPRRFLHRSPKWQSFYKEVGTIERRLNDVTYVVKVGALTKIVHVDKLKRVQIFE